MWVIFEGLDKSGKGTLEWKLLKATNFKHMVIDRGPVGYFVFDKILERSTKLGDRDFIHYARKIMKSKDFLVVYCVVDKNTVDKRLASHGETCPYDYVKAQKLYRDNIKRYYKSEKVIEIDTTNKTPDECVQLIIEKLKEAQNEL